MNCVWFYVIAYWSAANFFTPSCELVYHMIHHFADFIVVILFILTGYFPEVHPASQWLVWPYWSLGTHPPLDAWYVTDYIDVHSFADYMLAFICDLLTCIALQLYHIANYDWCQSGYVKWMTFRWLLIWGLVGLSAFMCTDWSLIVDCGLRLLPWQNHKSTHMTVHSRSHVVRETHLELS